MRISAKYDSAVSKLYLAVSHKIGHEVTDGRWVPSGELERLAALLVEECRNGETNDSKRPRFDRLLGKSLFLETSGFTKILKVVGRDATMQPVAKEPNHWMS